MGLFISNVKVIFMFEKIINSKTDKYLSAEFHFSEKIDEEYHLTKDIDDVIQNSPLSTNGKSIWPLMEASPFLSFSW